MQTKDKKKQNVPTWFVLLAIFGTIIGFIIWDSKNIKQKSRKPASSRTSTKNTLQRDTNTELVNADEKRMENHMNLPGYKTYCNTLLNEEGTTDIVMTSGSFKDSASSEAVDNYIGAAVATVGKFTSNAKWESRKLIIKIGFGKQYEISTSDCRKAVELFNRQLYQQASDFTFANLKEVKK